MRWRRRAHQFVLALYACAVLGCVAMVVGPWLNAVQIANNTGRGMGTVTEAGRLQTSVKYVDEDGQLITPRGGLLYPSGLGAEQHVWVTYANYNPDLVKVEGRAWTLSLIPALSVLAVASAIAMAGWFAVNRWVP